MTIGDHDLWFFFLAYLGQLKTTFNNVINLNEKEAFNYLCCHQLILSEEKLIRDSLMILYQELVMILPVALRTKKILGFTLFAR